MSAITTIASAISATLSAYNAEVSFAPEFELPDLAALRVVIVPVGTQYLTSSRDITETTHRLQIGVLRRCQANELPTLIDFMHSMARDLLHRSFSGAICTSVSFTPLYVPEHFRERRQFTSVLELECREFLTEGNI